MVRPRCWLEVAIFDFFGQGLRDHALTRLRKLGKLPHEEAEIHVLSFTTQSVYNWQILLKKSKIERLRKSREGRLLGLSAAARLFKTNTRVRGLVCVNRCGPSRRRALNVQRESRNDTSPVRLI